jgi:hypothetical protein
MTANRRVRGAPAAALLALCFLLGGALGASAHEGEQNPAPPPAVPAGSAKGNGLEGRVTVDGQVVTGGVVFAYLSYPDVLAFKPFAASGATADDGSYSLDLPPGKYFVVAKKRAAGLTDGPLAVGDALSYNGSNPITVDPGGYVHVGFSLSRKIEAVAYRDGSDPATGSLEGIIEYQGQPLEGAGLRIFLDGADLFRGQGYATAPPTGKSGAFRIDLLPESAFFLIVRKRAKGTGAGPIAEGDYFGYFVDNPVQVHVGKVAKVRIEVISKASEIGKDDSLFRATGTQIVGRILDKAGKVVPGVYAFAYEDKVMAHARPSFISREVDKEGRYAISLSQGGVYYIGARSSYGDSPGLGEWYGRYDASADHSVRVETGKRVEGIDIIVELINP